MTQRIAIIGMGISGSATLTAYYNAYLNQPQLEVAIDCYDNATYFGRGLPFVPDTKEALMNTRSTDLTYNQSKPGHYASWLQEKLKQTIAPNYTTRKLFGEYQFQQVKYQMDKLNAQAILHYVDDITYNHANHTWRVTANSKTKTYDHVHLCFGDLPTSDFYQLGDTPAYIHKPYPLHDYPEKIKGRTRVTVIGTSLSAIDVIKFLADEREVEQVYAFSRSNLFPVVDLKDMPAIDFKWLNLETIQQAIFDNQYLLTFEMVNEWIIKEMNACDIDFEAYFDIIRIKGVEGIRASYEVAETIAVMDRIATTITRILYYVWQYMPMSERKEFSDKYDKLFDLTKGNMPKVSADRLVELEQIGRLQVLENISDIKYDEQENIYLLVDDKGDVVKQVDWVVNATGLNDNLSINLSQYPLLNQMLDKGYLNADSAGGVSLKLDQFAVISPRFGVLRNLHPHGTFIAGSVYRNNSITTIQRYAQQVVDYTLQ